uniref:Uncharacterized protein n=1 Tax=Trieres chinensis TaxID=1514140 RepID=A0A7S1ZYL5_TRICV|mmetsp:Transcript_35779/g.73165  ORF Transcript_35779/g.73165 Transcript_35779/m.73165 type:complete len:170 (+) Transcript_35779:168-677(+)|eukprot:CAMPEP_0183296418 /NCGR_PEP_ID=MMETSP0160_2-20130417/3981_1 /TAXON_ID=2839 ORGANISM="Odontella Sinensis, Strain Grunow 1884" /NCGR_SAMPLE_ID=MMETSP0160_2 /ASSEMBLY_ACC=CAM_ASM_000250 /LENGTH=169 /DNA_ID=CAMNT_0025458027 /DNA_START=168 /DNA_END=677 /DNA_ORIENTATION=-
MADHPDFYGHLEGLAREAAEREADRATREAHQYWLDNSIGGSLVKLSRRVFDNPFVHAVTDSLLDQDQGNSTSSLLLKNAARLAVVLVGIITVLAIGRIFQMMIGTEIVIENEVVVVETVKRSDLEKEKRRKLDAEGEKKQASNGETMDEAENEEGLRRRRTAKEKEAS